MNERIKELADQAGVSITAANENGVFTLLPDDVGKFAKLIVRECAHKLLSFASIHESMERYDVEIPEFVQGNVYGLRCGAELIKQHLGVEE